MENCLIVTDPGYFSTDEFSFRIGIYSGLSLVTNYIGENHIEELYDWVLRNKLDATHVFYRINYLIFTNRSLSKNFNKNIDAELLVYLMLLDRKCSISDAVKIQLTNIAHYIILQGKSFFWAKQFSYELISKHSLELFEALSKETK